MPQTPESRVKALVSHWLREQGIHYFMPVQVGYGTAHLDYICCWHGRYVALETKAGTKLTGRQQAVIRAIIQAGGFAFVVGDEHHKFVPVEDVYKRLGDIDAHVRLTKTAADLRDEGAGSDPRPHPASASSGQPSRSGAA